MDRSGDHYVVITGQSVTTQLPADSWDSQMKVCFALKFNFSHNELFLLLLLH